MVGANAIVILNNARSSGEAPLWLVLAIIAGGLAALAYIAWDLWRNR